jgi:hypothetical protein
VSEGITPPKPILLIGLDPMMDPKNVLHIVAQLRDLFPSYFVAVVAGMRYATVLREPMSLFTVSAESTEKGAFPGAAVEYVGEVLRW